MTHSERYGVPGLDGQFDILGRQVLLLPGDGFYQF